MSDTPKKKGGYLRLILIVIIAIFCICAAIGICMTVFPTANQSNTALGKAMGLNQEEENTILEIFSSCGVGEITDAELFQEGESYTSYWVDDEETAFYNDSIVVWLDNSDKTISQIYYQDYDIYLDGTVIKRVSDCYVSSAQRDEYRVSTQLAINELLNFPDTAKYQNISGWSFSVSGEYHVVRSSVTADNALGVPITEDFQVTFENGNIISLILDGVEYIN